MNGVEILNSFERQVGFNFNYEFFLIVVITLLVTFIIIRILTYKVLKKITYNIKDDFVILLFGILITGVISFVGGVPNTELLHEVIISGDVSMNEFLEKYEIIKQDGKIFTIRERLEQGE